MNKSKRTTILAIVLSTILLLSTVIISTATTLKVSSTTNKDVIIHFYTEDSNEPSIYYWNALPTNKEINWPGEEMKTEGDNWYSYNFSGSNKVNFLFYENGIQSEEFTKKSGEWWYKDGKWTTSNPDKKDEDKDDEDKDDEDKDNEDKDDEDKDNENKFERTDFRDETIYFVMTTRFYDGYLENNTHCRANVEAKNPASDPEWRGDFQGLIDKLDYIKALGFSAVWVTPVVQNDSDYDYHGYHAYNFNKVDPRYESPGATYQDLIDAVHKKDMKIIQDVVFNHTSNYGEENLHQIDKNLSFNDRVNSISSSAGDPNNIYHHEGYTGNWESYSVQVGHLHGDCIDLNTENPVVSNYLVDAYNRYIDMGVDSFRVDTVKHMSRLTFNNDFIPKFKERGGEDFYMFGENCAKYRQVWNSNMPAISVPFYSWKESKEYPWGDAETNLASTLKQFNDNLDVSTQPVSDNAFLKGNEYHKPDYSMRSGLDLIDFPMHWNFGSVREAFNIAKDGDKYYNDVTWNVTYVDSHDFAPDGASDQRFTGSQETWAENLNLMFTFRGIPCIYYGSEIEFMKGAPIDKGPTTQLSKTGRAYFGDNIEGSINVTDFAEYTNATGNIAETLSHPLAMHIQRLNKIRRAVPALRKGQYSTDDIDGSIAFKRRYTENGEDSFVCVTISGDATFNNIPKGTYIDAITGDKINSDGTLKVTCSGNGNMRVYVLDNGNGISGKIGEDGLYLK